MPDPRSDDYFARAARRLGALTDAQLAECRHLQKTAREPQTLAQTAFDNAYLGASELFAILQEIDRLRAKEQAPRRRGLPWLAVSITASVALLLGFVVGLVLAPPAKNPPAPGESSAEPAKPPDRSLAQPSLDTGDRLLLEATKDQYQGQVDPFRLDDKIRTAILHLQSACALDPESGAALQQRGRAWLMLGDLERAEADLTRATELQPTSSQAWFDRGRVRFERSLEWSGLSRDPDVNSDSSVQWRRLAAEDFQKAREIGLSGGSSLIADAVIAWHTGGPDSAAAVCTGSVWLDSQDEDVQRVRGEVLAAKGEYAAALSAFDKALVQRKHFPEAQYSRGLVRMKLAQNREAAEDFTACIERRRFLERALFQRGQAYHAIGRYNSALSDWRRCLELGSPRSERLRALIKETEERTNF